MDDTTKSKIKKQVWGMMILVSNELSWHAIAPLQLTGLRLAMLFFSVHPDVIYFFSAYVDGVLLL
jgi:hypothetical protein